MSERITDYQCTECGQPVYADNNSWSCDCKYVHGYWNPIEGFELDGWWDCWVEISEEENE